MKMMKTIIAKNDLYQEISLTNLILWVGFVLQPTTRGLFFDIYELECIKTLTLLTKRNILGISEKMTGVHFVDPYAQYGLHCFGEYAELSQSVNVHLYTIYICTYIEFA